MAKLALCMKAFNAHPAIQEIRNVQARALLTNTEVILSVLNQTDIDMQDRATCETDSNYLQFIPYIACTTPDGRIFNYSRGSGSGEERLKSKLSVGLGGHVDSLPAKGTSLGDHLLEEATRELQEEIGIVVNPDHLKIVGILVDATTPVDIVHVGILCVYEMTGDEDMTAEADVIEKGEFSKIADVAYQMSRLENWSKLVVCSLA
jgi:predicted NUDIX family phosphoesterase